MLINRTLAAVVIGGSVALAGCSAFEGNNLGETRVQAEFPTNHAERIQASEKLVATLADAGVGGDKIAAVMNAVQRPVPGSLTFADGKDKANESWSLNIAQGTAQYDASEVGATSPAKVKAKIAEAAGEDAVKAVEQAFPGGVQGLVDALSQAGVL